MERLKSRSDVRGFRQTTDKTSSRVLDLLKFVDKGFRTARQERIAVVEA